ncbi:MAG: hypothetical protein IT294_12465 [Deltaproteobacteria bacterium]|nr:hypothetical protein [Deltaproteobacteria bacterium]
MTDQGGHGDAFREDLRAADDLAAAAIRENVEAPAPNAAPAPPPRRFTGPIVAVVCLVVFVTQLPALRSAFKATPSIRIGVAETDEETDACIDTLWKISSLLQYGAYRGGEMVEPLTQRPYVVSHTDDDTIVECPNPAAHSLRSLRVSTAQRAPEVRE